MLTTPELADAVQDLLKAHRASKRRCDHIAGYLANKVGDIYVPKAATKEYRKLVDQARFNVLPLVVDVVAQNLFVDGYRPTGPSGRAPDNTNAPIWDAVWQPNRMDARQAALYRPAVTYGASSAVVMPGELNGTPSAVITPRSPRKLTALYEDDTNDEWPWAAMVVLRSEGSAPTLIQVLDDTNRYTIVRDGDDLEIDATDRHGLGVVPVVRFLDQYADELSPGKIEPLLPAQRQLNQTTFQLLMLQQYASFRQRWATGMVIQEDPVTGAQVEPFNAAVNRVWQNESVNGKFGEFEQSDPKGLLESRDKTLLFISSMAQIPPHNLLVGAGISNISAEALAALEAGHRHDIAEHQTSFGESVEQMMRLAGKAVGDAAAWDDMSAQVVWRDTTPRSLGQVADALGKLAQMLEVPPEALWERIPNVTDQDIERWRQMSAEQDILNDLVGMDDTGADEAA